jgi:hypothetical protein
MQEETTKRRSGPIPGPETRKYTVLLEPEIADWAKAQPGGLSAFLRRVLREKKKGPP